MDAAAGAAAARFRALDAELAAKSSRVAELEARVSFLEAENARLRKALLACVAAASEEDPRSCHRLAGFLRKRESAEKPGGDVIEVSDEEEEGVRVTVDANASSKGRSPEEGVVADPDPDPTPRKRAVTGESEDEDVAEGGGGSSSVGVGLEDDDVLVLPQGRKRAAARLVTSDSEDEDANDGVDNQEEGGKPSKKRGFRGICDSEDEDATEGVDVVVTSKAASPAQIESGEDEDDMIPICQVLKKMRASHGGGGGDDDNDELVGEVEGSSTPPTRRSARLVKNQSEGGRAARRVLDFVEPKDCEGSEDDIEEEDDDDMEDFINDVEDSSENAVESAEESCDEPQVSGASESSIGPEESDSVVDYADVMARIGRKNKAKDWKFEGDMLAAFNEHPELCLKAVCALYRRQTKAEQMHKATFVHNKQGFSQIHAPKASLIAEFLLDGDLYGPVKKTISDLEEYDRGALELCHRMASNYSKQLFAIYQNKEDPYFHP